MGKNSTLTTAQLAKRWGVNPQTVRRWRMRGSGPPFFRPGSGKRGPVRYKIVDIEAWERERGA